MLQRCQSVEVFGLFDSAFLSNMSTIKLGFLSPHACLCRVEEEKPFLWRRGVGGRNLGAHASNFFLHGRHYSQKVTQVGFELGISSLRGNRDDH